jgi:hypothetical protein
LAIVEPPAFKMQARFVLAPIEPGPMVLALESFPEACFLWYQLIMAKATITGSSKKKRGRPALYEGSNGKGAPQIGLRLPPDDLAAVDAWIAKQKEPALSRPEAIRRLVELGLTVKTRSAPSERQHAALADLASKAIDSLKVEAPDDEKANRKRRLIKGPEEFREDRVDLPKANGK